MISNEFIEYHNIPGIASEKDALTKRVVVFYEPRTRPLNSRVRTTWWERLKDRLARRHVRTMKTVKEVRVETAEDAVARMLRRGEMHSASQIIAVTHTRAAKPGCFMAIMVKNRLGYGGYGHWDTTLNEFVSVRGTVA